MHTENQVIEGDSLYEAEEEELIAQAERIRQASIELAREDFDEFCERVMINEATGDPVRQQWFHEDWTRRREQHAKAVFVSAINMGKSNQFSIAYPVWMLGRNPRFRIGVVSKSASLAKQLTDAAAKLIEESPAVREIFPNLLPGEIWNTEDRRVQRPPGIKDPSLKPIGVGTNIMGMRFDIVILDDAQDFENSRLVSRRNLLEQWVDANPLNRLDIPKKGEEPPRVYFVGNAWHVDDIYERLGKRGWPVFRYPIRMDDQLAKQCPYAVKPKEEGGLGIQLGQTVWPDRFPTEMLDQLQKDETPAEWARARMCKPRADEDARIKQEWIQDALEKGLGIGPFDTIREFLCWDDDTFLDDVEADELDGALEELNSFNNPDSNFWIVSGVDLSSGESNDLSAIVTIAICKQKLTRFVLNIEAGKWQAPEIIERIKDTYARYGSLFIVENNGTQGYIRQLLGRESAIPIVKYTTNWTKADPRRGFELLGKELYNKKWVFPAMYENAPGGVAYTVGATEDIKHLCAELKDYDPRSHTGDRAMALWFAQILASRLERWQLKQRAKRDAWSDESQEEAAPETS